MTDYEYTMRVLAELNPNVRGRYIGDPNSDGRKAEEARIWGFIEFYAPSPSPEAIEDFLTTEGDARCDIQSHEKN